MAVAVHSEPITEKSADWEERFPPGVALRLPCEAQPSLLRLPLPENGYQHLAPRVGGQEVV